MSFFSELVYRLRSLGQGRAADRDTGDEFAFHLDMEAAKLEKAGHSPAEARRRAKLAFGSREAAREDVSDARGARWITETVRDVSFAIRQLRKTPGFSAAAVLNLALGIGASTAIFSVVDGVLLRPTPVADPKALVAIWETDRKTGTTREPSAWPDYVDLARDSKSFTATAAVLGLELNFTPPAGDPSRLSGVATSADYAALMGIVPLMGRVYTAAEATAGGDRVVLLGETFWRSRMGGDPAVVGKTVRLDDSTYTVIGILPKGADFGLDQLHKRAAYHAVYTGVGDVDVWLPLQADEKQLPRDTHPLLVVGRLASGSSAAGASQEVGRLADALERTYPNSNGGRGMWVEPLTDVVFGSVRPLLILLLGAVGLVLLVACVNVANLLLARGTSRLREVAVRTALGAGTGRLARQFLVENLVLALVGAMLGIGLAQLGLKTLIGLAPADLPRISEVAIDARVLTVALLVTTVVAIAFGMVPTVQSLAVNPTASITGDSRSATGSRGHGRFRQMLIVAELALSVTLVVSAGLLVRSFWSISAIDPGFQAAGVLKAEYQLPESRYPRDFSRWPKLTEIHTFNAALLAKATAIPGVTAVAIAGAHPLNAGFTNSFRIVGREDEAKDWPEISTRFVSRDYFSAMGLKLLQGRAFASTDVTDAAPVAIINEAAAKRFFANRDPLGQQIRFWGTPRQIVGVVADERFHGLTEAAPIAVYALLDQAPMNNGVILVRTSGDPASLSRAVTEAIHAVDPGLAVSGVEPLVDTIRGSVGQQRFAMLILVTFGALTLTLALVGIHGVLSYATAQRTREIGIRSALGASRSSVANLVMRSGLAMATFGIGIGLVGAVFGSKLLTSLLYGVSRLDPVTFVGVPATMLVAALLATWLPARRAASIQPIEALRTD